MLRQIILIATLSVVSLSAQSVAGLGFVVVKANKVVVYSEFQFPEGTKFNTYRIDNLKDIKQISVKNKKINKNSPIYNNDGENVSWEYEVKSPNTLPFPTLWLCLPIQWRVEIVNNTTLKITTAENQHGCVIVSPASEGLNIDLKMKNHNFHTYFYFGYDI